jgi:hypothetical protein
MREKFKAAYRLFRIAHNQIPILSENGFSARMQATHDMRELTGKWELPRKTPFYLQSRKYKTTLTFRKFMREN